MAGMLFSSLSARGYRDEHKSTPDAADERPHDYASSAAAAHGVGFFAIVILHCFLDPLLFASTRFACSRRGIPLPAHRLVLLFEMAEIRAELS